GRLLQAPMSFAPFLLDGHLGELTVPVDLVWGASDRLMSLEYAARMLGELPRARLTEVPSCGHIPQNECPSTFAHILLGVLDSEPPMERNENELPGAQEAASETEPTDDPS
ncbi:MAG: alpha/beta hydrolase, partial [Acidobacteriota bacterium]